MIIVNDKFHRIANGGVRPLDWKAEIKFSNDYLDLSSRAISLSVSRSFEFPYNIQSAIADISLDNHDGLLSFAGLNPSPISSYILPNRPIKISYGFKTAGVVPNFEGYTESMPTYDGQHDSIANFTAMDKLSQICSKHLPNMVMMRNVRTDQVIEVILSQLGLQPDDYNLEQGVNTIPFVYFDADKSVGNALKELIQAEDGRLWQDENGTIRFTKRMASVFSSPSVMTLTKQNVLSITPSRDSGIINQVNIKAEIRQIEGTQQVFIMTNDTGYQSADDHYRVPANGQATFWLAFDDPVWDCTQPTLNAGANTSSFTAVTLSGTAVTSGLSAVGTLFATSYKIVFTNTTGGAVSIKSITLFGQPAKLIGGQAVEYSVYDDVSVNKFGTISLDIKDNRCFGSVENITSYARNIIEQRSDYSKQITMTIKGDPALQLGDVVTVSVDQFQGLYQVTSISNSIDDVSQPKLNTELKLQWISDATDPFILNKSVLDGADRLG